MVLVYDPTAPLRDGNQSEQRKLDVLAGKTVGFIDNAKPNFDHLVEDLGALFVEKYGVARVVKRRKTTASIPLPPETVNELAAQCDLIITGSGD
jgi:hypothetical protein